MAVCRARSRVRALRRAVDLVRGHSGRRGRSSDRGPAGRERLPPIEGPAALTSNSGRSSSAPTLARSERALFSRRSASWAASRRLLTVSSTTRSGTASLKRPVRESARTSFRSLLGRAPRRFAIKMFVSRITRTGQIHRSAEGWFSASLAHRLAHGRAIRAPAGSGDNRIPHGQAINETPRTLRGVSGYREERYVCCWR